MWGLGLLLALSAMGRVIIGFAAAAGIVHAITAPAEGTVVTGRAIFLPIVGLASAAYLVWFAFWGHRALQPAAGPTDADARTRATRIVLDYAGLTVTIWVGQFLLS